MAKKATEESENLVLAMLRELRSEMRTGFALLHDEVREVAKRLDKNESRVEDIKRLAMGESVMARYSALEVEERLAALENEVKLLKSQR